MTRRNVFPAAALTALLALAACGGDDEAAPDAAETGGFGTATPQVGAEGTAPSTLPGVNDPAGSADTLGGTGTSTSDSIPTLAPSGADTAQPGS